MPQLQARRSKHDESVQALTEERERVPAVLLLCGAHLGVKKLLGPTWARQVDTLVLALVRVVAHLRRRTQFQTRP